VILSCLSAGGRIDLLFPHSIITFIYFVIDETSPFYAIFVYSSLFFDVLGAVHGALVLSILLFLISVFLAFPRSVSFVLVVFFSVRLVLVQLSYGLGLAFNHVLQIFKLVFSFTAFSVV